MYLTTVVILSALLGGISLYLSFRLLRRFTWVIAWLRGSVGLALLITAILVFLVAYDLGSYEELLAEQPIAALNFEKIGEQKYRVNVAYYIDRENEVYEIAGDQWQVDARVVRWAQMFAALGAKPGFRLDRLSGRYYTLEDERTKERRIFSLQQSEPLFDVWKSLHDGNNFIPFIDAVYGSAAYLPMADKATFQVSLSHNGLTALPMNEFAKSAIQKWH